MLNNETNYFYANNLDDKIKKYNNIKYWHPNAWVSTSINKTLIILDKPFLTIIYKWTLKF